MSTAIVSVTIRGAKLGQTIRQRLLENMNTIAKEAFIRTEERSDDKIICYEKEERFSGGEAITYKSIGNLMETLFASYDKVLCIMATGIVVRVIAPLIRHKSVDPAIVVMDERGQYAISLLSGHLGGANEWTAEIAQAVGAEPVITTATDVNGLLAPDVLARKLGLQVENFDTLVAVNSALVNGENVSYYMDEELVYAKEYEALAKEYGIHTAMVCLEEDVSRGNQMPKDAVKVIITDKVMRLEGQTLYLRPKTVTLGIGCRRGTSKELIREAVLDSLANQGIALKSVITAASVSVKADEVGLLEAMDELNIPIVFYDQAQMAPLIATDALEESEFVKKTIGVGNVCETTALLAGKSHKLVQNKTLYPKTTVAISLADWSLSELDRATQRK